MSVAEITQNYQWFSGAYTYLTSLKEDGTAPEGCEQSWLNTLKAFTTAWDEDNSGDKSGIHSVLNMRKEFNNGSTQDSLLVSLKNGILSSKADGINATTLVGKLTTDAGKTIISRSGSMYEQVDGKNSVFAQYKAAYDSCKYSESKGYFKEYSNVDKYQNDCKNQINKLATQLLDLQFAKV